jgi:hypothetical protein
MKIPPRKTSNHSFIGNKKHHENFNVQHMHLTNHLSKMLHMGN